MVNFFTVLPIIFKMVSSSSRTAFDEYGYAYSSIQSLLKNLRALNRSNLMAQTPNKWTVYEMTGETNRRLINFIATC